MATHVIFLIIGMIFVIYFWCKQKYKYWKNNRIPYIEPTLFFGNIMDIFILNKGVGLYISDFYNEPVAANSSVLGIYTLLKPALIIRDTKLIKSILVKDFNRFSNRYSRCDPHGDALGSNNLFFIRNPEWKEARSKLTPVFTSGKIKKMYPLMLEIAAELEAHLDSFTKTDKNAFIAELKEMCALFTTDMIATIAFGIRANSLNNPNGEFRKQGRSMFLFTFKRAFDFFVAFFLPNLVSVFRIKLFSREFSKFLRETINYVISEREKNFNIRNDLIDILISLKKEAALSIPSKHLASNNDFLVAQAAVFLTAGFETSSSTMAFALYELARCPDIQKRLRVDINEALLIGKGTIPYEKISTMEYLDMVIDEVLRLYPVLPFLDRQHTQIDNESGFSLKPDFEFILPDGMPVYIPIFAIQRDPKYWANPDQFDPERFNSQNKKKIDPMTYLPFGAGPHYCIGNRIGLLQTKIGLVHFLKNHYVTMCKETLPKMILDPKALILQSLGGIYLKIVNDNMYSKSSEQLY